ncbi:MAG: hypothetical protein ACI87E_004726, partial [Mariniblastus sp.]
MQTHRQLNFPHNQRDLLDSRHSPTPSQQKNIGDIPNQDDLI